MERSGDLLSESLWHISIAQARTRIWPRNSWRRYALTEEGLTTMHQAKPIGVPALIALYQKMANDNPLLRQMKVSVDYGEIMPNIPQMGRYFSSVGAALQIATNGEASPQAALQEAEANMRQK